MDRKPAPTMRLNHSRLCLIDMLRPEDMRLHNSPRDRHEDPLAGCAFLTESTGYVNEVHVTSALVLRYVSLGEEEGEEERGVNDMISKAVVL